MALFYVVLLVIVIGVIWKLFNFFFGNSVKNPFEFDNRLPLKPLVIDQKKRDGILKQNFKPDKVPNDLDAIIIGSGIGGLTTGAILSKAGKKVLVLEQHDQAGGCCHTFIDKGYEFDVGIHYIGDVQNQSLSRTFLDQISDGQIQWEPLSDDFDTVVFSEKDGKPAQYFPIVSDCQRQKDNLKKHFPNDEVAIDKYYELVAEAHTAYRQSVVVKFLPIWLVKILIHTGLIHRVTSFFKMNEKSVKEVADGLTSNQTLRDIFSYCFGDYGTVPSKAGFPMQALLTHHFSNGASYPIGGASEIAHSIIPVIERGGGKVLVRVEVTEILLNSNKEVRGVKVKQGNHEYDILAPLVISGAGIYNTFLKFLPEDITNASRLLPMVKKARGVAAISVFVGMDASAEELELAPKKNFWVFSQNDVDKACVDFLKLSKEESESADIPLMFISFPSTKDPAWDQRYSGKSTMAIVTLANYEWFQDWEKNPSQRRGDEYEGLKKTLGWKMIDQAITMFPKIKDHIDYVSVGSPLTNNFYLGSMKGEIYGMDHDIARFSPLFTSHLRPKTDVPGLYLSGQDVFSAGFMGGLYSGLVCAQQVLGRNILKDLINLHKRIKAPQNAKED